MAMQLRSYATGPTIILNLRCYGTNYIKKLQVTSTSCMQKPMYAYVRTVKPKIFESEIFVNFVDFEIPIENFVLQYHATFLQLAKILSMKQQDLLFQE